MHYMAQSASINLSRVDSVSICAWICVSLCIHKSFSNKPYANNKPLLRRSTVYKLAISIDGHSLKLKRQIQSEKIGRSSHPDPFYEKIDCGKFTCFRKYQTFLAPLGNPNLDFKVCFGMFRHFLALFKISGAHHTKLLFSIKLIFYYSNI